MISVYHLLDFIGWKVLNRSKRSTFEPRWGEPVEDDYVSFEGKKNCEGSSAFQLMGDDTWRVAYIQYSDQPKHYRICKADKYLRNFSDPVDIKGVTGPQHGSFMRITKKEYQRLLKWDKELKASH